GEVLEPGAVRAGGETFSYRDLVISTGSRPAVPDIPGLEDVEPWTSDHVFSSAELPSSLIVIGGSAVGCEIAQIYSAFGCSVTVIERKGHLLPDEEPRVAELLGSTFDAEGITAISGVE